MPQLARVPSQDPALPAAFPTEARLSKRRDALAPPADHPLLQHPKALITPHIGSRTFESRFLSYPGKAGKTADTRLRKEPIVTRFF